MELFYENGLKISPTRTYCSISFLAADSQQEASFSTSRGEMNAADRSRQNESDLNKHIAISHLIKSKKAQIEKKTVVHFYCSHQTVSQQKAQGRFCAV